MTKRDKNLELTISGAASGRYRKFLEWGLSRAHAQLKTRLTELSVALVDDQTMSQLHEQFLGISGPTDVLTFPLDEDSRGRPVGGEVVICISEARRMSRHWKTQVSQELLLYALHGMLHLSGFDDRTPSGYARMHHMEDRILMELGIGAIFAPADKKSGRSVNSGRKQHRISKVGRGS
jgi:rRNA maturation RNase YbeY